MKKLATKARNYVDDVTTEIRKASWPRRKELVNHTIVTLVASVALALFIFGADQVLIQILEIVYPG